LNPQQTLNPSTGLDFELPPEREAGEPPEARGLARDEVRLLVSYLDDDGVSHATFRDLPDLLEAGDVLVVNTSGTMNAALPAVRYDGEPLELRLSTRLPGGLWTVELRRPVDGSTEPFPGAEPGETLRLPENATVTLHAPYADSARLWVATLGLRGTLDAHLERYGHPIRYRYVQEGWPIDYYQTVYVTEVGSAEMPSAGRAFTAELVTALVARGIQLAPLLLHTGVASLEGDEAPYEEYYRVPPETARLVNAAHESGRRVIAVGTTVVRALETVTDRDGWAHPGEGWTGVVISPQRGIRAVDAMLTGLHEPRSSHLDMLEALADRRHLELAYAQAIEGGYLWHEFGDLHLILPDRARSLM
jgi:S-adenosylmethionine:tRNA ribosyltransferase-isomerase